MREIKLNFRKVTNENIFFNIMKESFLLPDYYSHNYDSLNECMRDLYWIEDKNILVEIENLSSIKNNNLNLYNKIIESIDFYDKFWNNSNEKNVYFIY